jgi:formyltetrahydrofolate synthetase
VIVATIRALKMHGGVGHVVAGKPLDPALLREDPDGVRRGCSNLVQHIEIVRGYGLPAVVAINAFPSDRQSEIGVVQEAALAAGAHAAVVSDHFARGGTGAEDLARAVWAAASEGAPNFRFLSRDDASLEERIVRIATRVYGADGIDMSGEAAKQLNEFERLGYGHLPVCMAKTQLSLSHDPELKGRPTGFRVPIRDARLFAGAGFVTAYCGDMLMMPGLPSRPSGEDVDINADGDTVGLF